MSIRMTVNEGGKTEGKRQGREVGKEPGMLSMCKMHFFSWKELLVTTQYLPLILLARMKILDHKI